MSGVVVDKELAVADVEDQSGGNSCDKGEEEGTGGGESCDKEGAPGEKSCDEGESGMESCDESESGGESSDDVCLLCPAALQ